MSAEWETEFDKTFVTDTSGERVDGYLLKNTGAWVPGDDTEYCTIARPEHVKEFIRTQFAALEQQLATAQAEAAALRAEHLWAKRLINCWWTAEQSLFNDVANPEGFENLENKTAVAIERWKEATKAAEDALAAPLRRLGTARRERSEEHV